MPEVQWRLADAVDQLEELLKQLLHVEPADAWRHAYTAQKALIAADDSLSTALRRMRREASPEMEPVEFIGHFHEALRSAEALLGRDTFAGLPPAAQEAVVKIGARLAGIIEAWPPLEESPEGARFLEQVQARAADRERLDTAAVVETVRRALQAALADAEARCREADWHNNNTPYVGSRVPYMSGPVTLAQQLRDACKALEDPAVRAALGVRETQPEAGSGRKPERARDDRAIGPER